MEQKAGPPPSKNKSDLNPILFKNNFRTAEKDNYKIEVWMATGRSPINPGYRVYLPKDAADNPPETEVVLRLMTLDGEEIRRKSISPLLRKTAIDGGCWESIQIDEIRSVQRKEKFLGLKGVWEINLDDPFEMDYRKPGFFHPKPGSYRLSVRVALKGGPAFQFDDLPYGQFTGRDPSQFKK